MNWLTEYDYEQINKLEKCADIIQKERKRISDIEFNINVYISHYISIVKNMRPIISEKVIYLLWNNINKEEKDEKFKRYYNYVNDVIKEHIIGDTKCSFKKTKLINDIICCGYGSYAYDIHFVVNGIEFVFTIPTFEHINESNINYVNDGKYSLNYKESEHIYSHIKASFDLEDLHKAFKSFIESRCNE